MDRNAGNILVVDDEVTVHDSIDLILGDTYTLYSAYDCKAALLELKQHSIDLVFLDIELPDKDGFSLLAEIKAIDESIDVVMLTADTEAKSAVRALKNGAYDYITKPFEVDEIEFVTQHIFDGRKKNAEITFLKDEVQTYLPRHEMIGESESIKKVLSLITKIAPYPTTVLITGESGTGKELVARALHMHSYREKKPFVALNCSVIPEHLLESELFGHEKGAYTGANEKRIGKFEMANDGTLFLDEISTMPMALQAKLLRVIQEREFERLGGNRTIKMNARIVAATNVNIEKAIEEKLFREDLYHRINVISIHVPPLRERRSDIALLIDYYLKEFNKQFNKSVTSISPEALRVMMQYEWPGNIRELKNVLERFVLLAETENVGVDHLPIDMLDEQIKKNDTVAQSEYSKTLYLERHRAERNTIINALKNNKCSKKMAAEQLGIHRNTLLSKIKYYEIDVHALGKESDKA